MKQLVMVVALLGCGGSSKPPIAPTPTETDTPVEDDNPELSPALQPLAFLLGSWMVGDAVEHWVAVDGAMYGVAFPEPGVFEVMIIDDGEDAGPADGTLRFIAMPGGKTRTEFRAASAAGNSVTFSNPEHDAPKTITYELDDEGLVATLDKGTAKPTRFVYDMGFRTHDPPIDEADKVFAADTLERGADGFMAHVAPSGFMLNRAGKRVEGAELRAAWDALTTENEIVWEPTTAVMRGELGFTVGKATFTDRKTGEVQKSTYCTIWGHQPDGTWAMEFDVGRVVND